MNKLLILAIILAWILMGCSMGSDAPHPSPTPSASASALPSPPQPTADVNTPSPTPAPSDPPAASDAPEDGGSLVDYEAVGPEFSDEVNIATEEGTDAEMIKISGRD